MTSVLWLVVAGAAAQGPQGIQKQRSLDAGPPRSLPAERRAERRDSRDAFASHEGQRLSTEERRQLRRDVHEAGRDLYRERMRPGRRSSRRE